MDSHPGPERLQSTRSRHPRAARFQTPRVWGSTPASTLGIKILNGYIRGMGFLAIVCLGDAHVEGINASFNASGIQATGVIIHNIMNYNLFVGLNGGGVVRENNETETISDSFREE